MTEKSEKDMVIWPSAVSTTLLSLRTQSTVVPCICPLFCVFAIFRLYPAVKQWAT